MVCWIRIGHLTILLTVSVIDKCPIDDCPLSVVVSNIAVSYCTL
jgi:hypothetical protein